MAMDDADFWLGKRVIHIRMRPSGRYHLYRQLWGLRMDDEALLNDAEEQRLKKKEKLFEEQFQLMSKRTSSDDSPTKPAGAPPSSIGNAPPPVDNGTLSAANPGKPVSKTIKDSYCEVTLPFADDVDLRGDYASIYGGIRFGKILEDLDVLAATVAYLHCGTTTASTTGGIDEKLTIVTAAVDRIDVLRPEAFDVVHNVRLRALATNVGHSSIEVSVAVETQAATSAVSDPKNARWCSAAIARVIMVARSADGSKAVSINRLIADSDRDRQILERGDTRRTARMQRDERSIYKQPPTPEESLMIHQIFLEKPVGVSIASTICKQTQLCHPQVRPSPIHR